MNRLPRWLLLSLLHPLLSLAAFGAAWVILPLAPPSAGAWHQVAFTLLHYALLGNVPGHYLLRGIYDTPAGAPWLVYVVCALMVALTWLVMVLPLCWCAGNCCRWLRR